MAQINLQEITTEIRRALDEVTLGNQVTLDPAVTDQSETSFEAPDLVPRIIQAATVCASNVRPVHVRGLWTPPFDPTAPPTQWPTLMFLIGSSVRVGGVEAQRLTMDRYMRKKGDGLREITSTNPIWVYENLEFIAAGGSVYTSAEPGDSSGAVEAQAIRPPRVVDDSGSVVDPGTVQGTLPPGDWKIEIGERLEEAILQYVLSGCFFTLAAARTNDAEGLLNLSSGAYKEYEQALMPMMRPMSRRDAQSEES